MLVEAVERVGMAIDAEIAAAIIDDSVEASIGFPAAEVPEAALLAIASSGPSELQLPGLGACRATSVPLEGGVPGRLVVARLGAEEFSRPEMALLRGMGRILSLSLRAVRLLERERALRIETERQGAENAHLLGELRERQSLLEKLSRLQRSIASRRALDEVLDAIVSGAGELLGDPIVGLRLIDPDDPSRSELVSALGVSAAAFAEHRFSAIGQGAGGRAIERGELVVFDSYADAPRALAAFAGDGLQAAMAAPIFERGEVAGSIVVASRDHDRVYGPSEREMLSAFAEHAGLALNDARATAETAHQAAHDSLTGLPNRAQFLERLERALVRQGGRRRGVAVLFADLDGFKTINDSLGHDAGDELLVQIADRLARSTRPEDLVARFGGDEFAMLIHGFSDPEDAARAAQRLLDLISEPFSVRGREVFVSASVGIALGSGAAADLLRDVDLAMYHAKSRGKGRYEMFEPGLHDAAVLRLELEADLKRAIEREELVLHYQPVCRLADGAILGLEALVRWRHPHRGLLPPAAFIPLAEESGQILSIGRWVLEEACAALTRLRARYSGHEDLQIAVNLSGAQLERADLRAEVGTALEQSGIAPSSLVLEITESALMVDFEANIRTLADLGELGVRIAVDDFGTGYSSLEYLRLFPLDVLKVARPFVVDLADPDGSPAITGAIIDMGLNLGLTVIAEGIETAAQRSRLLELGCVVGQGFHFAKPMPEGELGQLLAPGSHPSAPRMPEAVRSV